MNHYADDLPAVTAHLDLSERHPCRSLDRRREVVRYTARHGESGVATAALISAAPPLMVQTDANPDGLPNGVFDVYQPQPAAKRAVFYRDVASGPFYGFNRPGVELSEVIIDNWVHQGMMGAAKAHYDGIVASTQTDFTEDLKKITAPVLVMHRADDQIVPYSDSAPLSAKLVQKGTLKIYEGSRTACLPATLRRSATISWPWLQSGPDGPANGQPGMTRSEATAVHEHDPYSTWLWSRVTATPEPQRNPNPCAWQPGAGVRAHVEDVPPRVGSRAMPLTARQRGD